MKTYYPSVASKEHSSLRSVCGRLSSTTLAASISDAPDDSIASSTLDPALGSEGIVADSVVCITASPVGTSELGCCSGVDDPGSLVLALLPALSIMTSNKLRSWH